MTNRCIYDLDSFMEGVKKRNPGQPEFHQAVRETFEPLIPYVNSQPVYCKDALLERLTEPDRIITFRVVWEDEGGNVRVNRAWRVQFNKAIGPYKGGLRFHPNVTVGTLKFLGFEQIFKNSLTGLPMGGAKGGSNFNPKGKSHREVMRFCQSMMSELHRYIGEDTDIPAGDIGVGYREISYLYGAYTRMTNRVVGSMTGKKLSFGGSLGRKEATGYGTVYFMNNMLGRRGDSVEGRTCVVSGAGNVALYCIERLIMAGAKVVTASDSGGFIYEPDGIDRDRLTWMADLKENRRGRLSEYAEHFGCEYHEGQRPWNVPCDLAFPCATQNEIAGIDAEALVKNGVTAVAEGANMPSTPDAVHIFREARILYGPAKAANAGGVAVSGLEQSQNAQRISWSREEVDQRLQDIMRVIHEKCLRYGSEDDGYVDYVKGANIAGFVKVADAMLAYGIL